MRPEVLAALARVGARPDQDGRLCLFHATGATAAESIIAELRLVPTTPEDPAQRALLRDGGEVFLSSSPTIGADLDKGSVVLQVVIDVSTTLAEIVRFVTGERPRVELVAQLPKGQTLQLVSATLVDDHFVDADPSAA